MLNRVKFPSGFFSFSLFFFFFFLFPLFIFFLFSLYFLSFPSRLHNRLPFFFHPPADSGRWCSTSWPKLSAWPPDGTGPTTARAPRRPSLPRGSGGRVFPFFSSLLSQGVSKHGLLPRSPDARPPAGLYGITGWMESSMQPEFSPRPIFS